MTNNNTIKLGYSVGGSTNQYSLKKKIEILLSVENFAVELSYITGMGRNKELDQEDIDRIKQFDFVSIHAPALISEDPKIWIKYPSTEGNIAIEKLLKVAQQIDANAILFHPDLIEDFDWLNKQIGDLLVFENMDAGKSFGKTIDDLKNIFNRSPQAKWVCDVNHIYTMDNTMKLAEEFHNQFQNKLSYYHLSGYGGFHDALHISQEDVILQGIKDLSVPIINEGQALRDGEDSLQKENKYILDRLN